MKTVFCEYVSSENVALFTVICLPESHGQFPTVLVRSPYVDTEENTPKEQVCQNKKEEYRLWLDHGYAVVFQHCRGRGKSTGDCIPYIYEREDGLSLQDWVRKQPFYNGELYLYGGSYTSSVHYVTAPFAEDIKGAVLQVQDCERYNCNYRNGFYKIGLHGGWYVDMYKKKSMPNKNYTDKSYQMLPLSDFSKTVFGERAEDFDEILKHPNRNDPFWQTRYGGGEAHHAIKHAHIPILLVTGFYDIYTGGVFETWNTLDHDTKSKSALAVHPFDHGCNGKGQPINFENGNINREFENFSIQWLDSIRGKEDPPFKRGKVTYYKLFDNNWYCDDFYDAKERIRIPLGNGKISYRYDPNCPAAFQGGLSTNFGGNAWQDPPNSRDDILTLYTEEFKKDTFVKGKMSARIRVKSNREDTCFYMRISLCKKQGDYGLRDDINQISNFDSQYIPTHEINLPFSFDEHAFVIHRGEKLRIDISSSAYPLYVRHTNNRGLFSEQTTTKIADNTVIMKDSFIELPVK